jgi:uncharacterized lipoprotein
LKTKPSALHLIVLALILTLVGCGLAKKEKQMTDNLDKDSLAAPHGNVRASC